MAMMQAKFKCTEIRSDETAEHVMLQAIWTPSDKKDPNLTWCATGTPAARMNISITAKGAQGKFKVGGIYTLDFTPN